MVGAFSFHLWVRYFLIGGMLVFCVLPRSYAAESSETSTESAPLVVEEERVVPSQRKRTQDLEFTGAENSLPLENLFAIELRSLADEDLVSRWWRANNWFLQEPINKGYEWKASKLDIARTSSIRTRSWFQSLRYRIELEGGLRQDIGSLEFFDNGNTPLDSSDDQISPLDRKLKTGFGTLNLIGRDWGFTGAWDLDFRHLYLGSVQTGIRRKQEGDFAFLRKFGAVSVRPYVQYYRRKFSSKVTAFKSSESTEWRGGMKGSWGLEFIRQDLEGSFAQMKRSQLNSDSQTFERKEISFSNYVNHMQKVGPLDLSGGVGVGWLSDSEKGSTEKNVLLWESELRGKTNFWATLGLQGSIKRFALAPKPSEVFGDTSLIQPNLDLEPYVGLRGAVGPWYKLGALEGSVEMIWERGEQEKVTLVSFPFARTEAIGGTYMRGIRTRHDLVVGDWAFGAKYTYQQAINASEILWQRGYPIPGRPEHEWTLSADYNFRNWFADIRLTGQHILPLDLTGSTFRQSDIDMSASVSLMLKGIFFRLYGTGLLSDGLDQNDLIGTTPIGILEPSLTQRTVGLEVELQL